MEKGEYVKRINDLEAIVKEKDSKIDWLEGICKTLECKINIYNTVFSKEIVEILKENPNAFDAK